MELQNILQGLRKMTIGASSPAPEEVDDCMVCLCPYGEVEPYELPCKHKVCKGCRANMLTQNLGNGCVTEDMASRVKVIACPICRKPDLPTREELIAEIIRLRYPGRPGLPAEIPDLRRQAQVADRVRVEQRRAEDRVFRVQEAERNAVIQEARRQAQVARAQEEIVAPARFPVRRLRCRQPGCVTPQATQRRCPGRFCRHIPADITHGGVLYVNAHPARDTPCCARCVYCPDCSVDPIQPPAGMGALRN